MYVLTCAATAKDDEGGSSRLLRLSCFVCEVRLV